LHKLLCRLIFTAPWRDAKPKGGRARVLNEVDEIGVVNLYSMLAGGFLLYEGRRQQRAAIIDHICHRYGGISKSTVERVLRKHGDALPKPPRVLKPIKRR
jgi:hypothetical protein